MSTDPNFPATGLQIRPSNAATQCSKEEWDVVDSAEDIESFGIAGRVWEAAYAARRYFREAALPSHLDLEPMTSLFSQESDGGEPITVLELGAGAGYGGLHLCKCLELYHAQRGRPSDSTNKDVRPRVLLTDLPNVLPLLERNIARAQESDKTLVEHVDVQAWPCAWGDEAAVRDIFQSLFTSKSTSTSSSPLSHILAADLVYFPELFPPLLRSLLWLTEPVGSSEVEDKNNLRTPEVIFTYKVRSLVKEQPFWSVFGAWFDFEAVFCRKKIHPSSSDDHDESSSWRRFGERRSDVSLRVKSDADEQEEDDSDQQVYVFLARRKSSTFGWRAPGDDRALMSGRRERTEVTGGEVTVLTELDDTFEMLLLNSIGL
ncbi:unnamed protein product [Tilletia controversa]|uniref:Uncharacterized protein n=3 Tax=Tilletia TaxID=13289 RepID=A0A8X7MWQ1_9BASI|nr:hypothetical protein CF336_g1029 [Tilletia laevis]KAE8202228.1 hypothetical protein CF328_g2330 [Tilletia controversa]KAE8264864.1 hypothetical protein A4X03_0g641 [Tilletia caries]KAE8206677.1 hypothetical protein CF335_g1696 [Tilletia laevis]KAE8249978.1 hypothetical protein A4X06_0g2982 [Tilletia controversa]